MNFLFKPSFVRLFKKLSPSKQKQALEAIDALKTVLESNIKLEGLGLKRLSGELWEIRSSLKDRILFTYKKGTITFVLIGGHDDIIKYLKTYK